MLMPFNTIMAFNQWINWSTSSLISSSYFATSNPGRPWGSRATCKSKYVSKICPLRGCRCERVAKEKGPATFWHEECQYFFLLNFVYCPFASKNRHLCLFQNCPRARYGPICTLRSVCSTLKKLGVHHRRINKGRPNR